MNGHRERAVAGNEAMFRDVNEAIERAAARGGVEGEVVFLCECGDDGCAEELRLALAVYEHVRSDPTWFMVRPGHFRPDVEVIVKQNDRYWIVQKTDQAADVARETNPRT